MKERGRVISPEIRRSKNFGALNFQQRDLFQGLIEHMADDQGRMLAEPALIRGGVWPYDDITLAEVDSEIQSLAAGDHPFILIYETNGNNYIQIINWWKWQKEYMQYANPSLYPAPEGWTDRVHVNSKGNKLLEYNWNTAGGFCTLTAIEKVPTQVPTMVATQVPTQVPAKVDRDKDIDTDNDRLSQDKPGLDKPVEAKRALQAWNYALGELQGQMSRAEFESYVRCLVFSGAEGSVIKITALNRYTVEFLTKRSIKTILEKTLCGFLEDPAVTIRFVIDGEPEHVPKERAGAHQVEIV